MRRFLFPALVAGLIIAAAGVLAAASAPSASPNQARINLAWFMAGLRDLAKSRDAKLKLVPAQAKKILPELEKLVKDKIIITEIPADRGAPGDGDARWQRGAGQGQSGQGPSEQQRRELQERQRKQAEMIEKSIDRMSAVLKPAQSDYIFGLDFQADYYGLGNLPRPAQGTGQGTGQGTFNQAQIQKMLQARQEGTKRLVELNKEVLDLIRKLAK